MSILEIYTIPSSPSMGVSSQPRHSAGQCFAELKSSLLLLKASGSAELKQRQAPKESFSIRVEPLCKAEGSNRASVFPCIQRTSILQMNKGVPQSHTKWPKGEESHVKLCSLTVSAFNRALMGVELMDTD